MEREHAPLFFLSDAHLGAGSRAEEQSKSKKLHAFWEQVGEAGGDLVVVGDLFDFWFEFRHAIPNLHLDHLSALRRLVDSGRRVSYVAGNHDFWVGRYFTEELGVHFYPHEYAATCGGSRVVFRHGDGWLPGEHGYRMMRSLLRNRYCVRMFQLLSPDLGFPLARWVSKLGKKRPPLSLRALADNEKVARSLLQGPADILVSAHLHEPLHFVWPEGQWLVAGDWMRHFSFGKIEAGGPALYLWSETGRHTRVVPRVYTQPALQGDRD
jgi:UDP-2,3-diacylglucosamine hydrolase